MIKYKVHFKDTWIEKSTETVMDIELSTETFEFDSTEEMGHFITEQLPLRYGSDIIDGIEHKREIISTDSIDKKEKVLSKEQMFDFILNNTVTLTPDGSIWTDLNGFKVRKQYTVAINNTSMSGYDLVDAIHYYVNNRSDMK